MAVGKHGALEVIKIGYGSDMECDVKIKEEKIDEFRSRVKEVRRQESELASYFLDGLQTSDDGDLEWSDSYGKHYGDDEFVKFIAGLVEEGRIIFTGDDGAKWGYYFDGKGGVKTIEFIERINDDYFHQAPPENGLEQREGER